MYFEGVDISFQASWRRRMEFRRHQNIWSSEMLTGVPTTGKVFWCHVCRTLVILLISLGKSAASLLFPYLNHLDLPSPVLPSHASPTYYCLLQHIIRASVLSTLLLKIVNTVWSLGRWCPYWDQQLWLNRVEYRDTSLFPTTIMVGHFRIVSVIELTPSFRLLFAYEDCMVCIFMRSILANLFSPP